ncbi:MAG TPA: amidohydrolase [Pseudomonadales bacterium]|nr:amidohydrolase [Pseudomonadales bacterium]
MSYALRRAPSAALLLATVLLAAACAEPTEPAAGGAGRDAGAGAEPELILTNANVYSFAWGEPGRDGTPAADAPRGEAGWQGDARALAVRDGEILALGSVAQIDALKGPATRVVDLRGATVLPGLVDSHTHLFELGARLARVDVYDVATEEEAVARVVEAAKAVPPGQWIIGQGWDEGAWANHYPTKALLSAAFPDNPVYLRGLHGFAGWVNQRALDAAGITAATPSPSGGEIRKGADGEPTGLFLNRAVPLMDEAIPAPTAAEEQALVLAGMRQMARDGYVAVHDAGDDAGHIAALQALEARGELPIRYYAMLSLRDAPLIREWIERGPQTDMERMLVIRAIKGYYDGSLGARGARLLEDYEDMPGHRGVSGDDYGYDQALAAEAMKRGFQLAIHAIGDEGNRDTLDFIEAVGREAPATRAGRHRIEHAQVVSPEDIPRFGQLGVIASMEPPHAVEDKPWAEDRLGADRILGAYAWRSLRRTGATLTFNADNPGSDHSIFYGLHAAVTRRDKDMEPPGGWYPEEALTGEEAVRAYTGWSAYSAFMEDRTGVLAPGRWADITVMDVDPLALAETAPGAILDGRILMTVVGGKVVYEAP